MSMNRYSRLMARLKAGELVYIDGATGTEVERRGIPQLPNAWNGGAALSHPQILCQLHEDYILSGADIITSNTFATLKSTLQDAGVEDDFEAYNRRGVELACIARANLNADHVLVAGSISHWSWTENKPQPKELSRNANQQAKIMREAGADLIILEMMSKVESMLAILDGIECCELPIWVGLSCKVDQAGIPWLYHGGTSCEQTLAEAIDAFTGA